MNSTNWITNQKTSPFYTRKALQLHGKITHATASVCGLGQFIFYINGQKVGDHELDPGWTDYRKYIQYVDFDITNLLQEGPNVIGAEIGNGWYLKTDEHYTFAFPAFMPPNPNPYQPFGKSLIFSLNLEITYEDGRKETILTDESFKVKDHPIIMSNVYGSETIDARLEQKNWCEVTFDDTSWENASFVKSEDVPTAQLLPQTQPAIKVIKTYEGHRLNDVTDSHGKTREIYDFGQNMSGMLEIELKGKIGDTVYIYPAEKLDANGDIDQVAKGWVTVDSCITCILGEDDTWENFRMKFTYFAGKVVAIEKPDHVQIKSLRAHAITSAWKTAGTFLCDDDRYNKIYDMIEKTVEANMLSVHTDCPTIERFAWQEPNHLMAPSIFYMKDGKKLWKKFLLDMRTQQHTAEDYFFDYAGNKIYPGDGLMPSQCPCYIPNVIPVPGMGSFYDIIPWGSTCILGTFWHYQFYGDLQIVKDNYHAGLRYFNYLKTKVTEEGFINHGLGDWGNPKNELARENVETAFLYADAKTLSYFAKLLGKSADAAELADYAETVKKNYNEKLLQKHPTENFWCYRSYEHQDDFVMTQACEALPLFWGLVPEELEADVVKAFSYTLKKDNAFISGEVGLPYIIQTARKYEMNDLIAEFITRPEHPSYYAFILDGMTTLGEYWESNPRSHCHDMMGHIIEWFYNGIAGIIPNKPGFSEITLHPYLPKGMHEFKCTYETPHGTIRLHVYENENGMQIEKEIPEGILCHIS